VTVHVANAPVSYGVFELTIGEPGLPRPQEVLDAVAAAGYDGIDLGPLGFLGLAHELPPRLERLGLGLAGGYVALRFTESEDLVEDLEVLDATLDVFDAVRAGNADRLPKPTLADAGSPARVANPGRGQDLPEITLDERGWKQLAAGVTEAVARCRDRGFEPTFHHHTSTYVEAPQEIERLLELTDVGLCLDTGHLLLGGGDPLDAVAKWGERVNHLQIKDVRLEIVRQVVAERAGMRSVWERGAFCALGEGDLDTDGFLDAVRELGYQGWIVVEQDRILNGAGGFPDAVEAQVRNRQYLRARGL
jgi:inosose dehydratase